MWEGLTVLPSATEQLAFVVFFVVFFCPGAGQKEVGRREIYKYSTTKKTPAKSREHCLLQGRQHQRVFSSNQSVNTAPAVFLSSSLKTIPSSKFFIVPWTQNSSLAFVIAFRHLNAQKCAHEEEPSRRHGNIFLAESGIGLDIIALLPH